jgi:hypothetical protein
VPLTNPRAPLVLALALVAVGCGQVDSPDQPSDWMLGTFSDRNVKDRSVGLSSLGRYVFHDDGTLDVIAIIDCEENEERPLHRYTWSRVGDALVMVDMPEGDIYESWRVTPGEDCSTLHVEQVQHGDPIEGPTLLRGEVCMKELPPCPEGTSCETCETVWCDDAPPPCDD